MEKIEGGVTAAMGYQAAGVCVGIKKNKKDMALIYSTVPAKGAGTFTTNVVKAAPVKWDMKITDQGENVQAVVLNSGVANACTGLAGEQNNERMAEAVAQELQLSAQEVYTASTGVIGKQLPIDIIIKGAKLLAGQLEDGKEAGMMAAEAIMTTDTCPKEYAVRFLVDNKEVKIGGMAKGSGMIHPNMATMLGVVTTDLNISRELLQEALSADVKKSFNMISVDRDTSTNDSLLLLANGLAGNREITEKNEDYENFCRALNIVTTELAKKMAADGEGATKLLEVQVIGAETQEQAAILSRSVISSNLVKTTVFGSDANVGRFLCAMGYAGVEFNPDNVDLYIESAEGKLKLVENGMTTDYSEEYATRILSEKEVKATADLKAGSASATAWGCDLTYDYVKINADYRS